MKNKVTLIGLVGLKQSGKDTACNFIGNFSKQPVIRRAFADALKKEVAADLGVSVLEIEKDKEKYRSRLQFWGTEFRRSQDPDYWIKQMPEPKPAFLTVITDVRFEDEAQWVRDRGGLMVRIVRPGTKGVHYNHISEHGQALIKVDHALLNDGSRAEFMETIGVFMEEEVL